MSGHINRVADTGGIDPDPTHGPDPDLDPTLKKEPGPDPDLDPTLKKKQGPDLDLVPTLKKKQGPVPYLDPTLYLIRSNKILNNRIRSLMHKKSLFEIKMYVKSPFLIDSSALRDVGQQKCKPRNHKEITAPL